MKKAFFILCIGILSATFSLFIGVSFAEAQLVAPTSPSPSDGASVAQPVKVQWSEVEFPGGLPGGYILEVQGQVLPVPFRKWVSTNFFVLEPPAISSQGLGLHVNTKYSWQVRACFGFDISPDEENQCGPWSNRGVKWTFFPTLAKPTLLSPPNTTKQPTSLDPTTKSIKFEWEKVLGAHKYLFTLRKLSDGFTRVFEVRDPSKLVPDNFVFINKSSFPLDLQNSFAWKVSAQQSNTKGPDSDEWLFFLTLPKPQLLITPKNEEDVPYLVPASKFTWSPVPGAGSYVFEVFDAANTKVLLPQAGVVSNPSALELGSLPSINKIGERYSWQVTACEALNKNCGPPSTRFNFTLVFGKPPAAGLSYKPTPPRIDLQWFSPAIPPGTAAIKYFWEIQNEQKQTIQSGTQSTLAQPGPTVEKKTIEQLPAPGSYTLHVKACTTTDRGCSAWSADSAPLLVPDNEAPKIEQFSVNPKASDGKWVNRANQNVTISWVVSDTGGSNLKEVQVRRADFNDTICKDGKEKTCSFEDFGAPVTAPPGPKSWDCTKTSPQSCLTHAADDGIYWYGIRAVDKKENKITETEAGRNPVKVQVDKTPPTAQIISPAAGSPQNASSFPVALDYFDQGSKLSTCFYKVQSSGATTQDWTSTECREKESIEDTRDISVGPGGTCRDEGEDTCKVFVKATDIAGNEGITSRSFSIQFVRPTGSIVIDDGAASTATSAVPLALTCSSGCDEMRIANSVVGLTTAPSQAFKSPLLWELSLGDGTKAVYAQFRASGGLWSPQFADTIEFTLLVQPKPLLELSPPSRDYGAIRPGEKIDSTFTLTVPGVTIFPAQGEIRSSTPEFTCTSGCTFTFEKPKQAKNFTIRFTGPTELPEFPGEKIPEGTFTFEGTIDIVVSGLPTLEAPVKGAVSTSAPTGIFRVADRAANVVFTALLIAASLFIMIAAFQFLTGGGNPEQIASAKDKLLWAGVGIAIALVSKGVAVILQTSLGLPSTKAGPGPCPDLGGPKDGIQNPLNTICVSGLLDSILNVIFTLSLIVVPFVVLYAGFLFVTGGGNPEQITKARNTLIWTAVGFGVILIAKGLPFILKDILGI